MNEPKPFPITTGFFAMPLGLGALSLAWLNAAPLFRHAERIGNGLAALSLVLWLALLGCYVYRIGRHRAQIIAEFSHPVQSCLFSLVTMTTMISGDILYLWHWALGKPLVCLGAALHSLFLVWVSGRLWKGTQFAPDTLHPVHYLPPIAACFTIASSFGLLGWQDLGSLFLGVGILSWLAHEPIMLQRMRLSPLFPIARPSLGIVLAPSFVGSAAYLTLGGEVDWFVKMLWGYGFLQLFLVLRNGRWIAENGFSMGFWAFSFGLAAMARGAVVVYQFPPLSALGLFTFCFANVGIALLLIFTLKLLLQQR